MCQRTISTKKLKLLGEVPGYDLYYSLTHPLKWKPFGLETCTGPFYIMLNFYQINEDGEIRTRDHLVIKALIPCQRTISTKKLKLLGEVPGYDLYYSLTQWYQERSPTVIEVGHTSSSKASEPLYHWTARVALSVYRLWSSLVLLDSSRRDIYNDNSGVVVVVSICLQGHFCFFLFVFSLSSPLLLICEERRKRDKQKKNLQFIKVVDTILDTRKLYISFSFYKLCYFY
jgi:hypothetical protein